MKKHLSSILVLLVCGTLTLSVITSCSKSSSGNIAGTYPGTRNDSVSALGGSPDTVVVTVSGTTVTINDHGTGSTFTGTIGTTASTTTSGVTSSSTPLTITSQPIKQGTSTYNFSSSTTAPSSFSSLSGGGQNYNSITLVLSDPYGSTFQFTGTN